MRVGIDARMIFMSGIGTYLSNLIAGLARLGADHEYVMLLLPADRGRFPLPGPNFSAEVVDAPPYSLAEQVRLMRAVARLRLDLIHHPHYAAPLLGRTPMVATIHDLIHQLFPEFCPSRLAWRASWTLARRTAARARLLLTVSESTRRDIIVHLRVPPGKVRLTYNCLPPGWGEGGDGPLPPPLRELDGAPYFLYVGNHKRHKNLRLLLESFSGVRSRDARARLVLTGERPGLEADLARLGLKEEVIFLGEVPNPALPAVYRGARALVFPSRYEGFGYPPLEAMGCGTPPIVSDAASLPEVVGEGGVIVPEGAAEPLRDAMLRLLSDDGLRDALGQKGRERARAFSWEKLARGTLEAYREAASEEVISAAAGPGRAA